MLPCISFSVLLLVTYSTVPAQSRLQNIEGETAENAPGIRMRRSLAMLGDAAVQTLLKGAKFLYSNGFDSVFLKPGGFKSALDDFNSVNTAKRVMRLPISGKIPISKVGRVGDKNLILKQDAETSYTILQISQVPFRGQHYTVDPIMDKIIMYTD